MIDFAAMAKKAGQSLEKDTLSFREGETLIALVPFERGYPNGMPSLAVEVIGSLSTSDYFRRTVATTEQAYCRESDHFASAIGREVPEVCPLKSWAAENLGSKGAKTSTTTYWVVVPLAYRPNRKSSFADDYTKPKIMTAKKGKPSDPHIQAQIDLIMAEGGVELVQKLFDFDCQQLLVVERKGTGHMGSSFKVSLAEKEYAKHKMPADIIADIEQATKVGGPCDLNNFVAGKFFPDAEEISKRLMGGGSGMAEE